MKEMYAINVYNDGQWRRFATVDDYEDSKGIATRIAILNELWDAIEIESIVEKDGDFNYRSLLLFSCENDCLIIKDRILWNTIEENYADIIEEIVIEPEDNVCFLRLGFFSTLSNCGYFHFNSVEEFNKGIRSVFRISMIQNIEVLREYLIWACDNPSLFKSDCLRELERILYKSKGEDK